MREFLKSSGRRLRAGWFWPLVLLALPNCAFPDWGLPNPNAFDPGSSPLSNAVMCDIPKVPDTPSGNCADVADLAPGASMSRSYAAVALAQTEKNTVVLDYSSTATNACGGQPGKTVFFDAFPDGTRVCLNCPQMIPGVYADGNAVCVAKCKELVSLSGMEPPGGLDAYCQANAHVSTNFDKTTCYNEACDSAGNANLSFVDPRRTQEDIVWDKASLIGTSATGTLLKREAPTTGSFDAGAASAQTIGSGDGWVQFGAGQNNMSHVLGLSSNANNPGTDLDPNFDDIEFGISLNNDGHIYIIESGAVESDQGAYSSTDRFRVEVVDNHDDTATISYWKLNGACTPGTKCSKTKLADQTAPGHPKYPLRVDASLADYAATLVDVTLVRIQ